MEQWKRYPIPVGFNLVRDTREWQLPLFMNPPDDLVIIDEMLKQGDYSFVGYENLVTIERKYTDFFAYVGSERQKKTIPKLEVMSTYLWAALAIEGDPFKIPPQSHQPKKGGKRLTKKSVRDFLKSVRVHYGIHVFWGNRYEVEIFVLDHLVYCYNHFEKLRKKAG